MIGENKMKKICSLLLILCLIFLLSACKSDNVTSDNNFSVFCAECGEEVSATDKFCSSCGAPVNKQNNTTDDSVANNSSSDIDAPSSTSSTPTTNINPETFKPNTPAHTHEFSDATCTEPKKCFCGATEGKALGHKWNTPSCGQLKECTICGFTEGSVVEHNYITTISKNATCSDEGEKTIKCERCSHEYKENIERIAHNFVKGRCCTCKEFQEFYSNGSEKFLDEVLGVKFYYIGIANGRDIKIRVENSLNEHITVQTRNESVNGDMFVTWLISENIRPNETKEIVITPYRHLMEEYGYDSIDYIEFNFNIGIMTSADSWSKIETSPNKTTIYPYG